MADSICEESNVRVEKKARKRKKAFYTEIRNQMEFYFSDANLSKDRFMSKLMAQTDDGHVNLREFLKFKKILNLTEDINDIAMALSSSEMLEVTKDLAVMRKTAVQIKEDVDECTVYLEGFPPHVDHAWFHKIFDPFGKIAYLSLPRFKTSRKVKGFAFLEFETLQSAKLAFEHFNPEMANCEKIAPAAGPALVNEERKTTPVAENSEDDLSAEPLRKRHRIEETESTDNPASHTEESPPKKRRQRKNKRKEPNESEALHLRVMPKLEWKRLRNVYLTMQRANMTAVKKSLGIIRKPEVMVTTSDGNPRVVEVEMKSTSNVQDFTPRVIIKFEMSEPVDSAKLFRGQFKDHAGVLYIDLKDGQSIGHIRCDTPENAANLLAEMTGKYSDVSLLQAEAESEYWTKIAFDREVKVNGKSKSKPVRGKDKILKKAVQFAQKANFHIRFDD